MLFSDDKIQIQEYAPQQYRTAREPEIRRKVFGHLLQAINTSYSTGYALRDFDHITKGDRIRATAQDGLLNFKLIDFNITDKLSTDGMVKQDIGNLLGHYLQIFTEQGSQQEIGLQDTDTFETQISSLPDADKYFARALFYLHAGLRGDGKEDPEKVKQIIPLLAKFVDAQDAKDDQRMKMIYSEDELVQSGLSFFLAQSALAEFPESRLIRTDLEKMPSSEENIYRIYRTKVAFIGTALSMGRANKAKDYMSDDFISSEPDKNHKAILSSVKEICSKFPESAKHSALAYKILFIPQAKESEVAAIKKSIADLEINISELNSVIETAESKFEPTVPVLQSEIQVSPTIKKEFHIPLEKQAGYRKNSIARRRLEQKSLIENQSSLDLAKGALAESQLREEKLVTENAGLRELNEKQLNDLAEMTRNTARLENELATAKRDLENMHLALEYEQAQNKEKDLEYLEVNDELGRLKGE